MYANKNIGQNMLQPRREDKIRIAVVWTEMPGYLSACLRELAAHNDIELLVISNLANRPSSSRRGFDEELFKWMPNFHRVQGKNLWMRMKQITDLVWNFDPHVLLLAFQWRYPESYVLVKEANRRQIPVIGTMDNPWQGTLKQQLMIFLNRRLNLMPLSVIWVPGERTVQYAKRLFDVRTVIWRGLYSADTELFSAISGESLLLKQNRNNTFLYVGRFSQEKGVTDLIEAYKRYRSACRKNCWKLQLIGDGPLRPEIEKYEGIEILGFLQPNEVSRIMKESGAFILPSHYEPWGVALHEATLSGMPVVCSDSCGASVELVQDKFNGLIFRSGNIDDLVECMLDLTNGCYDVSLMGRNSTRLAQRYSTQQWMSTLMCGLRKLKLFTDNI